MFRKFLANWLLTTTEQTVTKGVTGVLELHLNQYNIRSKTRAKEMKVPQFIYDEYLTESNRLGVKQTRSFAGVQIGVSSNNRFEFI
ncbi:hypothetical protein OH460_08130 [Vibrio sp. Makdt]|uniref:hypothetical protein n=1 Tax=Vibrio sp. Makdt TaxID=2998828 RepID=UPI0022CD3510|nr:hypothetical protein [Vibrio sp. Makdt]MDA0152266.1 hypothetical protein [Vibrio sp. Makdt]